MDTLATTTPTEKKSKVAVFTVTTTYSNGLQSSNQVQAVDAIGAVDVALTFDRKIHGKGVEGVPSADHIVTDEAGKQVGPEILTIFA